MFNTLLIANRGEIACRIIRSAKQLGIECVAVYSEADRGALHVELADSAFYIGAASSKDSYLNIDAILAAAKKAGADAVHPGYGFLSENAEFARRCQLENITFIGPPVSAIEAMGSKQTAKLLMEKAKVPTVPGYHGKDQSADYLLQKAKEIGFPVLLKAASGGGGKGMRAVYAEEDFKAALAGAKREAMASFNDDVMLIEKLLIKPRHIELQIFADTHGNCVHLFDRDCSIQRRHQKIIEEAPAPDIANDTRKAMAKAAIQAAKSIDYVGAGTVEFLLAEDGAFYFMEMNTRLQVEHPVTEMVTGIDLVEWQIRVADKQPLPLAQADIGTLGHAIEARLYAEDPSNDYLPASGTIAHLQWPQLSSNLRIDHGIRQGETVSMYYDPMIAKIIVFGDDRKQAISLLCSALAATTLTGIKNNCQFLHALISDKRFSQQVPSTAYLSENPCHLIAPASDEMFVLAAIFSCHFLPSDTDSPWVSELGFKTNFERRHTLVLQNDKRKETLSVSPVNKNTFKVLLLDKAFIVNASCRGPSIDAEVNGTFLRARMIKDAATKSLDVFIDGKHFYFERPDCHFQLSHLQTPNELSAPIPGTVVAVLVKPQQVVKQGESLLVMEAMKMEHTIYAPSDGVIDEIFYAVNQQVDGGAELLAFSAVEAAK